MSLPTFRDLNRYDSLDERHACGAFLGKTLEQVEAMLRDHAPDACTEDLMGIGPIAFRYYLAAVDRYVRSPACSAEFVDSFGFTLERWRWSELHELTPVARQLVALCDYVVENWSRFPVDPDADHEDVCGRYRDLRTAFAALPDMREASDCQTPDADPPSG